MTHMSLWRGFPHFPLALKATHATTTRPSPRGVGGQEGMGGGGGLCDVMLQL